MMVGKSSLSQWGRVGATLLLAAALASPMAGHAQPAPPPGDPLGPDVFTAITKNDVGQLKLLLDKGAKTEAVNWLGIPPLFWAATVGNEAASDLLIERKANVNAESAFGGALETAVMGGHTKIVKRLLDKGATFSKSRGDGMTATMMAADNGNVEILNLLLAKNPDVNAADNSGVTALMQASRRGQTDAARLLLGAGAKVNVADGQGRTPLMYAALNGHTDAVNLLLKKGASVNEKDKAGDTALILSAKYSGIEAVAAALKKAGADATIRDAKGRIAADIARSRGYGGFAMALQPALRTVGLTSEKALSEKARQAVALSLPLIEKTTNAFSEKVPCASCHHQGIGLMTTGTAKSYGYTIDALLAQRQQKLITGEAEKGIKDLQKLVPHPEMYNHFPTVDMNEFTPAIAATFTALKAHDAPRTEATDAIATMLARLQSPNGSWEYGFVRAPVQSSVFTMTAYGVRAIQSYMPESLAKERDERIARALTWLKKTPAKNSEDNAFRLLGLKWAGATQEEIDDAAKAIRATQRTDGGWAQFPTEAAAGPNRAGYARSDAYATGQALFALYLGGGVDPATDPTYQRGVEYLLRTQDEDGSWFVNKRAVPVNNYFDTGFPHGQSQYISYSATCFATMSLMFAAEPSGRHTQTASANGPAVLR